MIAKTYILVKKQTLLKQKRGRAIYVPASLTDMRRCSINILQSENIRIVLI